MARQLLPIDRRWRGIARIGAHQGGIKMPADLFVKAAHGIEIRQMVFEFGLGNFIEGRLRVDGRHKPRESLRPLLALQKFGP